MNSTNRINKYVGTLAAGLMLLVAGCSEAERSDADTLPDRLAEPILFAAQASSQILSRAAVTTPGEGKYVEEGPIRHGMFSLTYWHQSYDSSNANSKGAVSVAVADVNFDVEGFEGLGLGFITSQADWKELAWRDVYEKNDTFYMDNALKKYFNVKSGHEWKDLKFKSGGHPFVAGVFDYVDGTNDLLWGVNTVSRGTNPVKMELHHNMAIVRLEIRVDESNNNELQSLDLSNAEVCISAVVHEPYSYNRKDGNLTLAAKPDYKPLVMADPLVDENLAWATVEDVDVTDEYDKSVKTYKVYTTKDFVLPPQGVPEDDTRPRLIIKIKDTEGRVTRTFSGILPHAMWENPTESSKGNPLNLAFLKEHKLVIRTVISQEPPELVFMPVVVLDWVDKGTFKVDGHQAGVYSQSDFLNLVDCYNSGKEDKLGKYGCLNGGSWEFRIFSSFVVDYDAIHGKMKPENDGNKKTFSFDLSRYVVRVAKRQSGAAGSGAGSGGAAGDDAAAGDGTYEWIVPVTAEQLYKIVSEDTEWTPKEDGDTDKTGTGGAGGTGGTGGTEPNP